MEDHRSGRKDFAELGQLIKRKREERHETIRGLAARAGVDASGISRIEHGTYGAPSAQLISRIATALEINVSELYLAAGYDDGRALPGFAPYLRAKYNLPSEAIDQLEAHFELISDKYQSAQQGNIHHDTNARNHRPT